MSKFAKIEVFYQRFNYVIVVFGLYQNKYVGFTEQETSQSS